MIESRCSFNINKFIQVDSYLTTVTGAVERGLRERERVKMDKLVGVSVRLTKFIYIYIYIIDKLDLGPTDVVLSPTATTTTTTTTITTT